MMDAQPWAETQRAFGDAAAWFVDVAAAGASRWDDIALGEWTVRDLTGHASRALLTVEEYLDQDIASASLTSPVEYFRVMAAHVDPADVAQRGREAGTALGDDIPEAVAGLADRVCTRVNEARSGDLVSTPAGGMRLNDYLPTRTFELTVHTCDLAAALGQRVDPPHTAAIDAFTVLGELAIHKGDAGRLFLAATGREALPDSFTVL